MVGFLAESDRRDICDILQILYSCENFQPLNMTKYTIKILRELLFPKYIIEVDVIFIFDDDFANWNNL